MADVCSQPTRSVRRSGPRLASGTDVRRPVSCPGFCNRRDYAFDMIDMWLRCTLAQSVVVAALTMSLTSGCAASPGPAVTPNLSSSRKALTAQSDSAYAVGGFELGVSSSRADAVCPYEVATWIKSLTSDGLTVDVSARGPVGLTVTIKTTDGAKVVQHALLDSHHSESLIDVPSVNDKTAQSVTLAATSGGKGTGGTCLVAPASGSMTGTDYCNAKSWPQSILADVVGLSWDDATTSFRELGCFLLGKSISTRDGHDVGQDTIDNHGSTEILSVRPGPGSRVGQSTVVNLKVRPAA